MSFRLFIYYSALCGGWAAFVAALVVLMLGARDYNPWLGTAVIAGIVGLVVAAAVGTVDAVLNAAGSERVVRALVCLGVGLLGGIVGGLFAQALTSISALLRVLGWIVVGVAIGASVGVYDLLRGKGNRQALRKIINGVLGGAAGGLLGGVLFELLRLGAGLPRFSLTLGLVILGAAVGLMIGLAQVILKEAWVKVEAGFRAGREMMLSKAETVIGRAEGCDIGLFGDTGVEKRHARIILKGNRYLLEPIDGGATLLNDEPVSQATPLRSGDLIKVGTSVLRFGERRKQPARK